MGKLAFVFSGQGAQYTGMGKELYEVSDGAKHIFDMADRFKKGTKEQCFTGSKAELSQTINTQPCLFCVDLAASQALKENGIVPDVVAGFSLGEISALSFADCFSVEDAFNLVCKRALWMNDCSERNKGVMMAVIGISGELVKEICTNFKEAFPVNFNCQTQTVVACSEEICAELTEAFKANGAKALRLPVSGAFHSPHMNYAYANMKKYLEQVEFEQPKIPVFANATAQPYEGKEQIAEQITSPVLWQKTIENMINDGVDTFVEVGAGKTLSNFIKKIDKSVTVYNVEDKTSLETVVKALAPNARTEKNQYVS